MQNIIKNMYKSRDVFICKHPTHEKFDFQVSPYHVLKVKKCLKEGCVEFLWRCKIGQKGKKCPRGYNHVGRNCFSCKYYHEEKICRMPVTLLNDIEYEQFKNDFDNFEYWLSSVENKRLSFSGQISSVFPLYLKTIDNGRSSVALTGFLLKFDKGYIGYDLFDDTIYLRIGRTFLENHRPAPGDDFDCQAQLVNDRGRMILIKPSHVEISKNGGEQLIDFSRALVARTTGAIVTDDIRLCRHCPYGALLDVREISPKENFYRRFFCMRGVENAYTCPIRLARILHSLQSDSISA